MSLLAEIRAMFKADTADLQELISGIRGEMDLGLSKDFMQRSISCCAFYFRVNQYNNVNSSSFFAFNFLDCC